MKKKWWLIGLATLAICSIVAVAIPLLQSDGPGVTKANFDRIKDGMTREEIVASLGESSIADGSVDPSGRMILEAWYREDGAACFILFDRGRVNVWHWTESTETIPDKLRRWLWLPRK